MRRDEAWILPAIIIAGATITWALILSMVIDYPARPSGLTSITALVFVILVGAVWRFLIYLAAMWRAGVEQPIRRILENSPGAIVAFTPTALSVLVIGSFFYAITYLKSMIVGVVPFWADAPLAAIDRALFVDPVAIATSFNPALPALGFFYGLWHVVHIGGILWVLHWRSGNRSLHIVSFMMTWFIGMAFAFAFSSAGPIFTGQYDPSIAPESVRRIAALLWANYQAKGALLGGGISAFPSMHVAIATWFALVLRDRNLSVLGAFYVFAIFACSIILGWHYAADGIAGIAIAVAATALSRRWLKQASAEAPMSQPAIAGG